MIIDVPPARYNPQVAMQQAGYTPFGEGRPGEWSFVRRLGTQFYPRFHVYLTPGPTQWRITLHLDQKKPSYAGTSAHGGEYSGDLVEQEGERLRQLFGG